MPELYLKSRGSRVHIEGFGQAMFECSRTSTLNGSVYL